MKTCRRRSSSSTAAAAAAAAARSRHHFAAAHPTLILPHLVALSPAPDKNSLQQPTAAAAAHPRRPPAPDLQGAAAVALTTKPLLLPARVHRLPLPSVLCISKV